MKEFKEDEEIFLKNFAFVFELAVDLRKISMKLRKVTINEEKLEIVTEKEKNLIYLLLYHFSKLQDTLGHKIFRSIIVLNSEDSNEYSVRDMVNKMEKWYILDSAYYWFENIRKIRNKIVHHYVPKGAEAAETINEVIETTPALIKIVVNVKSYAEKEIGIDMSKFNVKKLKIEK